MEANKQLILVAHFCTWHEVSPAFVQLLREYGLVNIVLQDNQEYFEQEQLPEVEKMARLHYEMDINLEGIEVINHLLQKIHTLQSEVRKLNNRPDFTE